MPSKQNRLFGEILKLAASNVSAQLLPFFATPILSRLFLPEAFALRAFIIYINNIFDLLFRFSISISVFKDDEDAYKTWCLTVMSAFFFSIIAGVILFISPSFLLNLLSPKLHQFSYWIVPLPFFGALIQVNTFWLLRKKKFLHVGLITISRTFPYTLICLIGGFLGFTENFLLLKVFVISVIIAGCISSFIFLKNSLPLQVADFSSRNLLNAFKLNKKYIKNGPFFSILENLASLFPMLLITKFYSLEKTGVFSMVTYLFLAPSSVIATSINQVLIGSVQKYKEDYDLTISIKKTILFVVSAAIFGTLTVLIIAPQFLPYFLGERWQDTGRITQILIFPCALRFIVYSLSSIITGLGYIKYIARWQLFYFLFILLLLFPPYIGFSFEKFLITYAIIDCFSYIVQGIIIIALLYHNNNGVRCTPSVGQSSSKNNL